MPLRAMTVGYTGVVAHSQKLAVIGNNLANLQTAGFKKGEVRFEDIYYQTTKGSDAPGATTTPLGIQIGLGTQVSATPFDNRQGPLQAGNDLDAAISGEGFFRVKDNDGGVFYTRYGNFYPKTDSATGPIHLQTARGPLTLEPAIVLPGAPGQLTINTDGVIFQGETQVGQLELVQFRNPQGLLRWDDQLFQQTSQSGPEISGRPQEGTFGAIVGGFLEGSNVDFATELTDLLTTSQGYNLGAEAVRAGNQRLLGFLQLLQRV